MTAWPLECSHIKNWLFENDEQILNQRQKVHEEAAQKFRRKYPDGELPSLEEAMRIVRYLAYQLNRLCGQKFLRPVIKETAGYFFNRFYLTRSVIEYDPRIILFTCMTLAIKAEDYGRRYFFNELFGDMTELDTQVLLELELPVCDALDFNLLVLHTREPLLYLRNKCFERLKEDLKPQGEQEKEIQSMLWRNVWAQAEALCSTMQETDIPLLYTPSQMAVAAFLHYGRLQLNQLTNIDLLVQDIVHSNSTAESWSSIKRNIDDITERLYELFSKRRYTEREEVQAVGKTIQSIEENIWKKTKGEKEKETGEEKMGEEGGEAEGREESVVSESKNGKKKKKKDKDKKKRKLDGEKDSSSVLEGEKSKKKAKKNEESSTSTDSIMAVPAVQPSGGEAPISFSDAAVHEEGNSTASR